MPLDLVDAGLVDGASEFSVGAILARRHGGWNQASAVANQTHDSDEQSSKPFRANHEYTSTRRELRRQDIELPRREGAALAEKGLRQRRQNRIPRIRVALFERLVKCFRGPFVARRYHLTFVELGAIYQWKYYLSRSPA